MKLDIKQKATSNLPLKPISDDKGGFLFDGFVPSRLVKVEVVEREYEKGEFEGLKTHALNFVFSNYPIKKDEPERFLIHTEKIIGTKEYKGEDLIDREEGAVENNINEMWKRIKHIIEELKYSPNYRDIESISEKDYAKYFEIPTTGTPVERNEKFNLFFDYIAKFINGKGEGESMLIHPKDKEGYPCWLNIQASYPNRDRWSLPTYVAQGFMEAMRFDSKLGQPIAPVRLERKPADQLILKARAPKGTVVDESLPGGGEDAAAVLSSLKLD